MLYLKLFWEFLLVGLFSFGGAYSGIPLVRDVVLRNNWCTEETYADIIAISESTPGSIIVNLATYVGSIQAGLPGAIIATFAVVLPAFVIILILAVMLKKYHSHPIIESIFKVLRASITAVILATGVFMIYEHAFCKYIHNSNLNDNSFFLQKTIIFTILMLAHFIYKKKYRKTNTILLIFFSAILAIFVFTFIKL